MKNLIIFAIIVIANVSSNAQSAYEKLMAQKQDNLNCLVKKNNELLLEIKSSTDKLVEINSMEVLENRAHYKNTEALLAQGNKIAKTGNVISGINTGINALGVVVDIVNGNNTINAIDRLTSTVAQNQFQPYRPWGTNQGTIYSYGRYVNSGGTQFVSSGITAGNPGVGVRNTGTVGGGYYDMYGVWHDN